MPIALEKSPVIVFALRGIAGRNFVGARKYICCPTLDFSLFLSVSLSVCLSSRAERQIFGITMGLKAPSVAFSRSRAAVVNCAAPLRR